MLRTTTALLLLILVSLTAGSVLAQEDGTCSSEEATALFRKGFSAATERDSDTAMRHFRACLEQEPNCIPCLYEIGWTYWTRGSWKSCIASWEQVLELEPTHEDAKTYLVSAKDYERHSRSSGSRSTRVPIGTRSKPEEAPIKLTLSSRFQNYKSEPKDPEKDHYDKDIFSPKSVRFSADGAKVYVNSLEGYRTVVYDSKTLEKLSVIDHRFTEENEALFQGETTVFGYPFFKKPRSGKVNHFRGKPVESEISHGGRYLWVPYYRRNYDGGATSPSAVAIIDTSTDQIVRVMPTGPIPKYVEASPDGNWVSVTHWGDNTVGLIDTSSGDPKTFKYRDERMVVVKVLSQRGLAGENRDKACGYCLRGTVFTPDSKTLLVARMSGGGIAGFDIASGEYLGTVTGMKPTPRHLVIGPKGKQLFLSSNSSGYVSRIELAAVVAALREEGDSRVAIQGWSTAYVGSGARTIGLGPEGRYIFSAANVNSEVVVIDSGTMNVVGRVRSDKYTVGLAVSPDGKQVWTTSQGKPDKGGGNSVCVFSVDYP